MCNDFLKAMIRATFLKLLQLCLPDILITHTHINRSVLYSIILFHRSTDRKVTSLTSATVGAAHYQLLL